MGKKLIHITTAIFRLFTKSCPCTPVTIDCKEEKQSSK